MFGSEEVATDFAVIMFIALFLVVYKKLILPIILVLHGPGDAGKSSHIALLELSG